MSEATDRERRESDPGAPAPGDWTDDELRADERRRAARRRELPRPYLITEEDNLLSLNRRRAETLDDVIAAERAEIRPGDGDRAIWRDGRLLALLRAGAGGGPEVIRFDDPPRT